MTAVSRWATRIGLLAVARFFLVNIVSGPGVPTVISGRPALTAHSTIRFVTWTVYWINLALVVLALATSVAATTLSRLVAPRRANRPRAAIANEERFLNGRIGKWNSLLLLNATLADGNLELWGSPLLAPGLGHRVIPMGRSGVIWFIRVPLAWVVGDAPTLEESTFEFTPRNPRRWLEAFQAQGVPVRPVGLRPERLPRLQVGIILQMLFVLILLLCFVSVLLYIAALVIIHRLSGHA